MTPKTLMTSLLLLLGLPSIALASSGQETIALVSLTDHLAGFLAIGVFVVAYTAVIFEEQIHLSKSKPVLLAAGLIWLFIAIAYSGLDQSQFSSEQIHDSLTNGIRHNFLEYAELFFFLLVAMTYINAMLERGVFDALRYWLVQKGFSYRQLFWMTGFLAFFISPVADNLTTALIMCAVVMAVGRDQASFVSLACINIVVAANAGGAFSPFGDITTLMVWMAKKVDFSEFFVLFLPSLVNFVIPAFVMQFALPKGTPSVPKGEVLEIKYGGITIVVMFLMTVVTAICFHNFFHLPPVYGMMAGLAYLKFYGYYLRCKSIAFTRTTENPPGGADDPYDFDVFKKIAGAEWDTLFFFYGVILAVGGLGFIGYLGYVSEIMYATKEDYNQANILVGILSAIVDNIPVMFAVLKMDPVHMTHFDWLLVTLTAGVGGSMLSIGSAAGVALMGQARGQYTFFSHLKWTPVIALGYAASIWVHFMLNSSLGAH